MFQDFLNNELSIAQIEKISNIAVGSATSTALRQPLMALRKIVEKAQLAQEYLVPSTAVAVQNSISQMRSAYQELLNADLANAGNPASFISQKVEAISTRANEVISFLLPIAAISVEFDATKLSTYERQAAESIEEIRNLKKEAANFVGNQAVSAGWEFFSGKSTEYKKVVKIWAASLAISVLLTAGGIVCISLKNPDFTNAQTTAWSLFPFINILALSWFAINLISRNLRSYQHLTVLNETKATILKSGLSLIAASKDGEDNSDLRAALFQNCFSVNEIGFLRHERENSNYGNSGLFGMLKQINSK